MDLPPLLHVDEALVVVVKPAGLLAVPGRGPERADCLWARLRTAFADCLVVHRLDMATSGLMVFARGLPMQRRLSAAFAERRVAKTYTAQVHGLVAGEAGAIDLPLRADWPNRPRQIVDAATGKPALTRWRVCARDAATQTTRLELAPVTGRSHQLRVHLLAIGHPIVGDALYAPAAEAARAPRLLLHASALALAHPAGGQALEFVSPAPF